MYIVDTQSYNCSTLCHGEQWYKEDIKLNNAANNNNCYLFEKLIYTCTNIFKWVCRYIPRIYFQEYY